MHYPTRHSCVVSTTFFGKIIDEEPRCSSSLLVLTLNFGRRAGTRCYIHGLAEARVDDSRDLWRLVSHGLSFNPIAPGLGLFSLTEQNS